MKKAFTLVELLVVIGIIGVLTAVLIGVSGGATEKARTVKCATNMKNLAAAVGSYAMGGSYPYAQSALYVGSSGALADNDTGLQYGVHKGWISWQDQGVRYPLKSPSTFTQCSFASSDRDAKNHALTNGAIWTAVGKHRDCYMCPNFREKCKQAGVEEPGWSYQMSAYFGYDREPGQAASTAGDVIGAGGLSRADRILLFAEIPALTLTSKMQGQTGVSSLPDVNLTAGDGSSEGDGCLIYKSKSDGNESIGFNHMRAKQLVGHVAFADGHVETIVAPKNGNFVDLTDWLCRGVDVVYREGSYDEIKDSESD